MFYTSIGLAISRNGGESFEKYSEAPILQRSKYDPWMVSGGTVIRNNKEWLMYYLSGFKFEFNQGKPNSFYDIKIARSNDGINWNRNGDVALGLKTDESNISRMSIIKTANKYKAWFPVKKIELKYRCGFASSIDGINWDRKYDDVLQVSDFGWDSAAIDKMEVIEYNGNFYMFYNGNSFGIDGIGLAVANE